MVVANVALVSVESSPPPIPTKPPTTLSNYCWPPSAAVQTQPHIPYKNDVGLTSERCCLASEIWDQLNTKSHFLSQNENLHSCSLGRREVCNPAVLSFHHQLVLGTTPNPADSRRILPSGGQGSSCCSNTFRRKPPAPSSPDRERGLSLVVYACHKFQGLLSA